MPGIIQSQSNIDITPSTGFSTNFPVIENPISQGGSWLNGLVDGVDWHNMKTTANGAVGSSDTFYLTSRVADNIAHIKTSVKTFTPAQFATAVAYKLAGYTGNGGSHECELLLRFSISANVARGYECSIGQNPSGTYAFIVRWNGPIANYTTLKDPGSGIGSYVNVPTTLANGDVLYAEITAGNVITLKQNTRVLLTVIDNTWASGQAGMGTWPVDGAITGNQGWSSYQAGNL